MDCERLISLVEDNVPLWDMRDKRYHRRDIQKKLWTKIADDLGVEVDDVKRKWHNLRDTFRKEFNKVNEHRSGDGGENNYKSVWSFYDQMQFLKGIVSQRRLQSNLSPKKRQHKNNASQEDESIDEEGNSSHLDEPDLSQNESEIVYDTTISQASSAQSVISMQPPTTRPTCTRANPKRKLESACNDPFLEIEKQKVKLISENSVLRQNPDYLFLQSLLPFLMRIPENRKLQVRNKLQQVLIDEEDRQEQRLLFTPLTSPSSSYEGAQNPVPHYSASHPPAMTSPSSPYVSASPVPMQQSSVRHFPLREHVHSVQNYLSSFTPSNTTQQL